MKALHSTATREDFLNLKFAVFQAFSQLSPEVIAACAGDQFPGPEGGRTVNVLGRSYKVSSPRQFSDLAKVLASITDHPNRHLLDSGDAVPIVAPRADSADADCDLFIVPTAFLRSASTRRDYPLYHKKLMADIDRGYVTLSGLENTQAQRYLTWLSRFSVSSSTPDEHGSLEAQQQQQSVTEFNDNSQRRDQELRSTATAGRGPIRLNRLVSSLDSESAVGSRASIDSSRSVPLERNQCETPGFHNMRGKAQSFSEGRKGWSSTKQASHPSAASLNSPYDKQLGESFLQKHYPRDFKYAFDAVDDDDVLKHHCDERINAWRDEVGKASHSIVQDDECATSKNNMGDRLKKISYLRTLAPRQVHCDNPKDEALARRARAQRTEWCETMRSLIETSPEYRDLEAHLHESIFNGEGARLVLEEDHNRNFYLQFLRRIHQTLGTTGAKNTQCLIGRYYRLERSIQTFGDFDSFKAKFFPKDSQLSYTEKDYIRDLQNYINDDKMSKILSSTSLKSYIKN